MFLHSFKYNIKCLFRDRAMMFWCLLFPIILSTLFQFAFSNLDKSEAFTAIPVAAIIAEDAEADVYRETLDTLSKEGDDQLLKVRYTNREEALELLRTKEVIGILDCGENMQLTVSSSNSFSTLTQSILSTFVEQFNLRYATIREIMASNPAAMPAVLQAINEESISLRETSFIEGNFSQMLSYFYNLIAMACLYASFLGSSIAYNHQANQSPMGARRAISPVHKLVSITGGLSAAVVLDYACIMISIFYMRYILGIDFGKSFGYVLLVTLVGVMTGVSIGFFVGCLTFISKDAKMGVLVSVSMLMCMLSGLMFAKIQLYVDQVCPMINRFNPAALVSNSFFALAIYPSQDRLLSNLGILMIEIALFTVGGFLCVRRKKYASL